MVQAFHSFWSKPHKARNNGKIDVPDYELLVLMLSALAWQEHNGPIRMITDSDGAAFFHANGLSSLWSEPVDTCLDDIPAAIDPFLFWAAGKLFAMKSMDCPCASVDTDLIIWKDISTLLAEDIVAAHAEDLMPGVYPDPAIFALSDGYTFPEEWDFGLNAANTAFLYIPHSDFLAYYIQSALDFMSALQPGKIDPTVSMCFAEQRILPMCAKARGIGVRHLLDVHHLDRQDFVTHLWGYKRRLKEHPEEREKFCIRCVRRITDSYPQWKTVLAGNELVRRYIE